MPNNSHINVTNSTEKWPSDEKQGSVQKDSRETFNKMK